MATHGNRQTKGEGLGFVFFFLSNCQDSELCFQLCPASRYFIDVYFYSSSVQPLSFSQNTRMLITSIMHTLKSLFWAMVLLVLR